MPHIDIESTMEAVREDAANPEGYLNLAAIFERTGKVSCGRTPVGWTACTRFCCAEWAYRQAWMLAPGDATAHRELARICGWGSREVERIALEKELREKWLDPPLAAIGKLGATEEPDAVPLLLELAASDRPAAVAGAACAALERIGDPRGFVAVAAALYDPRMKVQEKAVAAIRRFGTPRATDALVARLESPAPLHYREEVLRSLGDIGHPSAVQLLKDELLSGIPETAHAAADGLARMGHRAALAALMDAVLEPGAMVRHCTAAALANYPEPLSVDALLKFLEDAEPHVRLVAATSLVRLGEVVKPAREAILSAALREKDEHVRIMLEELAETLN